MAKLKIGDLKKIKEKVHAETALREGDRRAKITVHMGTCGIASGAREVMTALMQAIEERRAPLEVSSDPCQEVVEAAPDLDRLPILRHCELDGGNYISSGVMIAHHPQYGQNVDFHRLMQFSKNEMAVRVVRSRHFDTFLRDRQQIALPLHHAGELRDVGF